MMNEHQICEHLESKLEEFLLKIEDSELKCLFRQNAYFAGGCIYCLHNDKPVKDYDFFLKDESLIDKLHELNIWSYTSNYALTCGKFQVVIKYFGEPEFCVGQFDFKHNMHYYVPGTFKVQCAYMDELFGDEPEIDDFRYLETNELYFNENRARDVEGVLLRIKKFTDRGMTISKETKKKIKQRTTKKAVKAYKKSTHHGNRTNYY